ncbi:hypothetical protein niasHT_009750 [Heterodera trifolii]|uniref:CCHC-type domain-containing protein n=1 Tax=Heterodera trifolii TaxID=157864 RepID=A0ABD2IL48_9BILA
MQTRTVMKCLTFLRPCFNGLIRVVCFYAGQAKEIGTEVSALNLPNVMVTTVDGCQGHEAEFVFVVTTKAGLSSNDNSGAFWNDERRVNVALSRSKFGMMVVGDLKLLWTADGIWRRFLRRALDKAIAVTPEYIHAMMDPKPQFVDGVIATTNGSVKAFDFYDDWQGSDGPSLPRSIRPPRMLFAGISRQQQSARQPGSAHPNVPAGLCHYCLRPGHYYRNCPDRPSPSPNMPRPTSSRPVQTTISSTSSSTNRGTAQQTTENINSITICGQHPAKREKRQQREREKQNDRKTGIQKDSIDGHLDILRNTKLVRKENSDNRAALPSFATVKTATTKEEATKSAEGQQMDIN